MTEAIFAEAMADAIEIMMAKAVVAILEVGFFFIEGVHSLRCCSFVGVA